MADSLKEYINEVAEQYGLDPQSDIVWELAGYRKLNKQTQECLDNAVARIKKLDEEKKALILQYNALVAKWNEMIEYNSREEFRRHFWNIFS